MKKLCVLLLALLLAGCSLGAFDASGYVKASLDKIYPGQVASYAKLVAVDPTVAEAEHKLDMQKRAGAFLLYFGVAQVSGETMEELCAFCDALYAKSQYKVGKARKPDENTREVPVTVAPLALFQQAAADVNACIAGLKERNDRGEFLQMDETAYGDLCVEQLLEILTPYLDEIAYLPAVEMTVRVRQGPAGWAIADTDLETVDESMLSYPKRS